MITKLRNKISHLFHPIQGEIWCLHRVVEKRSDYPSNRELEITPDYLERLITEYKSLISLLTMGFATCTKMPSHYLSSIISRSHYI